MVSLKTVVKIIALTLFVVQMALALQKYMRGPNLTTKGKRYNYCKHMIQSVQYLYISTLRKFIAKKINYIIMN